MFLYWPDNLIYQKIDSDEIKLLLTKIGKEIEEISGNKITSYVIQKEDERMFLNLCIGLDIKWDLEHHERFLFRIHCVSDKFPILINRGDFYGKPGNIEEVKQMIRSVLKTREIQDIINRLIDIYNEVISNELKGEKS